MSASGVKTSKIPKTSEQVKAQKLKKQNKSVAKKLRKQRLGFIATISFVMIVSVLLAKSWDNWNKIQDKKEHIAELQQQYDHMRINNEALQQKADATIDDEYIREVAREQGYRGSDEILFYLNDGE